MRPKSMRQLPRRNLLRGGLAVTAGLGLGRYGLVAPAFAADLVATPRQTPGPFYPSKKPLDADSDLVQVVGRPAQATGEIVHVFGQVMDLDGRLLPGTLVEIWQCDALGRYHHPRDQGGADPNFQGYGHSTADADGGFHFRTIEPVPYGGRTPHIHFAVTDPKGGRLTTQLYFDGDPFNDGDAWFNPVMALVPDRDGVATIDFVV